MQKRLIRLGTVHGEVRGYIRVHPEVRTLDDLNLSSVQFLHVEEALEDGPEDGSGDDVVAINGAATLWVVEVTPFRRAESRIEAKRFGRTAVRLAVGEFDIQGFLHVAESVDALERLNRDKNRFIALTSASVSGPDCVFGAPFLMVNREQIVSARVRRTNALELEADAAVPAGPTALGGELASFADKPEG
jgi:hypothetical protein